MNIQRIHHLNCGSPLPDRAETAANPSQLLRHGAMVCHCLVIDTDHGLVLVDAGYGQGDVRQRVKRLGLFSALVVNPRLDERQCAVQQLRRLGYAPEEVKHIVLTHLDLDHAGGIADFPQATIHCLASELENFTHPPHFRDRWRYRAIQAAHDPHWQRHSCDDTWYGFTAARVVADCPDIMLVSLPGHTAGHAGVAVKTPARTWLLHAGDAFFSAAQLFDPPQLPWGLRLFQRLATVDVASRETTLGMLRQLYQTRSGEVMIFNAHDYGQFEQFDRQG